VLATGAQGEEFAALMRIATKQHKNITLTERDTIVLSSSVIPGNEINVQKLKDNLYRNGVTLIHYRSSTCTRAATETPASSSGSTRK
jgi:ribonuclease J